MHRSTSRILLVDEQDRVLLFLHYGKDRAVAPRWITPGGGVDPGESHEQAGLRELIEETGLALSSLPEPFLDVDFDPDQRWHPYQTGHWAWYSVRVANFAPSAAGWTDEEQSDILEWRWVSADEMAELEHEVEPAELPVMLRTNLPPRA